MFGKSFRHGRIANASPDLNAVARICLVISVSAILIGFTGILPARGQTASVFVVTGVDVDRSAETAATARQQAIVDGHRQAYDRLISRLVPLDQQPNLPPMEYKDIVPLVLSFGIDSEKTSSVRYLGKLRFQFRRAEIRRLLNNAGVGFAETRSKPMLLLPVYDSAGAKLLWDEPNPWFAAWNAVPPSDGLVPLRLPVGDLADVRDISAEQASAGNTSQLALIGERYGAAAVLVAEAAMSVAGGSGGRVVNVTLQTVGGTGQDRTGVRSYPVADDETEEAALARAARETAVQIEEDWKRDNLLRLNRRNSLVADVDLTELREWVEMRRRLARVAFLQNSRLVSVSRTRASVELTYFGDTEQLRSALAQRDLILEQGSVNWVLREARSAHQGTVPDAKPANPGQDVPAPQGNIPR